jgi:CotH kinase protein
MSLKFFPLFSLIFQKVSIFVQQINVEKYYKMLHIRYLKSILSFYTLMAIFSFFGCKKKEMTVEKPINSLTFKSFILEKKNNPQLSEDVVFTINSDVITASLPYYYFKLVPTFTSNAASVEISGQPQTSAVSKVDFRQNFTYNLVDADGSKRTFYIKINWDSNLPQLNIVTNGGAPVNSKDIYVQADISINGKTVYNDYKGTAQIRGRGNSTWGYPKKPYKLKLDAKAPLFGLAAEKDWILLANYLDGTHTLNPVALKIGKLLNIPFTNNVIPVELTLNGQYQGCYMITEQLEVKNSRINIGNDGILLQMDTNFDDIWKFKSANYQLPVMVMHPDLVDATQLTPIKNQFEQMEALVARSDFPNNNYLDYMDAESIANYLIVYMLTDNEELNHPKSTYLYKTATGKWTMGPIWDFDWAYSFEGGQAYFTRSDRSLFWGTPSVGTRFFSKLMTDPRIKTLMKQKWADFKTQKFPELMTFVDDHTFMIQGARERDYQKWKRGSANFKSDVGLLKAWLQNRVGYMNGVLQ